MSSIPLISHRTFVSAIAHESKGDQNQLSREPLVNHSNATLEVLDATDLRVEQAARALPTELTRAGVYKMR